jgi:adenosylcobyric acid synthase
LGICGGYQMLGQVIADPDGVEGLSESVAGLGHLPLATRLTRQKQLLRISGTGLDGAAFTGYEIHVGQTALLQPLGPLLHRDGLGPDGAISGDGRIAGCYAHGLFDHSDQRAVWLARIGAASDGADHPARVDAALDEIAAVLAQTLDVDALLGIAAG